MPLPRETLRRQECQEWGSLKSEQTTPAQPSQAAPSFSCSSADLKPCQPSKTEGECGTGAMVFVGREKKKKAYLCLGFCSCKIKHFWQGQHGWFFSLIKELLIRLWFIFLCAGHLFQLQSSFFFLICLAASIISAKNTCNIKDGLLLKPYVSCRVQQKFSF